jgi:hypothetical protein
MKPTTMTILNYNTIAACLEIRNGKIKKKPIQLLNTNITLK